MKKIIAIASLLFLGVSLNSLGANAQVNVQVNINSQPGWGPTGYDYAQFYYFPDYDFYYDISRAQYLIFRNNIWSYVTTVPSRYRFDPYNAYKVVINQNKPYLYNKSHRSSYAQFKGQGGQQPMIRDSKDTKYYESKGHPNYTGRKETNTTQNNTKQTNNQTSNNRQTNTKQNTVRNNQQNGQTQGGVRNSQTSQNKKQNSTPRNDNARR